MGTFSSQYWGQFWCFCQWQSCSLWRGTSREESFLYHFKRQRLFPFSFSSSILFYVLFLIFPFVVFFVLWLKKHLGMNVIPFLKHLQIYLPQWRSFAASIAISETSFWITGGLNGPEGLKTSEYIENGVSRWVENSFRKQC